MTFHVPERNRVRTGAWASDASDGNNGAFFVSNRPGEAPLKVIASDGEGWEHVSVSLPNRCPTWSEMAKIKGLFWDEDDCVVQFHPPKSEYVNNHPYCLHLWRPTHHDIPTPPSLLVGYKDVGVLIPTSRGEEVVTLTLSFELFTARWWWLTAGCTWCYLWGQFSAFVWYEIVRDLWLLNRDVSRLHSCTWELIAMFEKKGSTS